MEQGEDCERGKQHDGRDDVGDEHGLQPKPGTDDDGNGLADMVLLPVGGVNINGLVLLLSKSALGMSFAGGTCAEHLHLHLHMPFGSSGDDAVVSG